MEVKNRNNHLLLLWLHDKVGLTLRYKLCVTRVSERKREGEKVNERKIFNRIITIIFRANV